MKRALVVIDVQNEYFTGNLPIAYPPREESLARIVDAIDAANAAGIPVVMVQHSAPAESPLFGKGGHSWELHEDVAAKPYDKLVEKTLASSYARTDLGEWLDGQGVDTVSIVGYMTQNCDESTARDAYHRGQRVEFLSDATGTVALHNGAGSRSAQEVHEGVLVVMQSNFAAVVSTADWIEAVKAEKPLDKPSIWASTR
ncbi:cysteine hydrolase family protein [Nonomuraea sp. NPDC050556]|uniref:cysteine hydrolase family protein n=1 Tax=Nonomuraea sp. NPDC050556 TaxID=3364369 RepID=UPI00379FFCB4